MRAVKGKRILAIALTALLLVTALSAGAIAAATKSCTISAETVSGKPGSEVTVAIQVADNPGFTNFGIALDYDTTKLELVSLNLTDGKTPYLCGSLAKQNPAWNPAQDENAKTNEAFDQTKTYPYVVSAASEAVKGNGTLFTATFRVLEGVSETVAVTPVVSYIRDNTAVFAVFEPVKATVQAGGVQIGSKLVQGDFNNDGRFNMSDIVMLMHTYNDGTELTPHQAQIVDKNGNGRIDMNEIIAIMDLYNSENN